jgi:ERCC4-related helicase
MRYQESNGKINDVNLTNLMNIIESQYGASLSTMEKVIKNWDNIKSLGDLQKIETLMNYLKTSSVVEIAPYVKKLGVIVTAWEGYRAGTIAAL